MHCPICDRLNSGNADSALVYEFPNSILVVGEHQYYPGYCVLLLKQHYRELHEMPSELQHQLNVELMQATQAIANAFEPWKINHASLGNVVGHVHWHIIPRYEHDPQASAHPWIHEAEFPQYIPSIDQTRLVAARIREHL